MGTELVISVGRPASTVAVCTICYKESREGE